MVLVDEREQWTTARIIDETTRNLYNIKDENGFRKYLQYAKWYVHRVSLYNPPPSFDISRNDLSVRTKKELASYSKNKETLKEIWIEVICSICELANTSDFNQVIDRRKIIPRLV
jgi:hypothetical protein